MSKIEVDQITQQSGTTITVGGGACKTAVVDATTVTLGRCGGSVALASGASQTGFGRTGTVDWQTDSIKTSNFTAVNGEGYFINTTGGSFEVDLPAGSAGAIVAFKDYANTFDTNPLEIDPNGSEKIGGGTAGETAEISTEGASITLVYVDSTKGWLLINDATITGVTGLSASYISATGGTISTIGDFKYHKFTSPGTFTVCSVGNPKGSDTVTALVVAGGAAGQANGGGGGGAGGIRNVGCLPVSAGGYPVTIGAGGTGGGPPVTASDGSGSTSITITSAGGGKGGAPAGGTGGNGGSGGGAGGNGGNAGTGGTGNTPSVSPPQGNPGGSHGPQPNYNAGAGGGGGSQSGQTAPSPGTPGTPGGHGGNGTDVSPSFPAPLGGSPAGNYAGGGGGGGNDDGPGTAANTPSAPGGGGAGAGTPGATAGSGTANTGGGGGGAPTGGGTSGSGGSGIVIIKYKYQN